ncbi:hypothetical protein WA026_020855 [Henosepilachna vigintioctopunctata]
MCGKSYKNRPTLLRHLKLECGKEPQFHCEFCPYKTKRKFTQYSCSKCCRIYKAKRSLWRHQKYECDKEAAYPCHILGCPLKFKRKYLLAGHLRLIHHWSPQEIAELQQSQIDFGEFL